MAHNKGKKESSEEIRMERVTLLSRGRKGLFGSRFQMFRSIMQGRAEQSSSHRWPKSREKECPS